MIFPLFINYIDYDETCCFELIYLSRKLQQQYLLDLDSPKPIEIHDEDLQNNTVPKPQFLSLQLLEELYTRTNILIDLLENSTNINSLSLTSQINNFEIFSNYKFCMKQNIFNCLKMNIMAYQEPSQKVPTVKIFKGGIKISSSTKLTISQYANILYNCVSQNSQQLPQQLEVILFRLDGLYEFASIQTYIEGYDK
ncbi:Hypothetical_protein [Hexamita inflata]|uniref:Hypothetical_protein n=1 Tax=Hexamita inflata TaxID=28002 RepID=A0AA86Q6B9_9EUKA|nr:Hypothetical protein HINF_LOCUS39703 [Hexamita inflata]